MQASNADVVFVAAYPPDTVGIVTAAHEVRLAPKIFGGTMVGLLVTPIKMRLGPLMNGIVIMESFVPSPEFNFPGLQDVLAKYRVKAAGEKIDPFGYGFVPFAYAAGQVLAAAVTATKSLDHGKLAATSTRTSSRPLPVRLRTTRTVTGLSRARCSPNSRTLHLTIWSNSARLTIR